MFNNNKGDKMIKASDNKIAAQIKELKGFFNLWSLRSAQ